jgi:hypothetical protein
MDPNMELKTNCTKSTLQKKELCPHGKNARVCWQEKPWALKMGQKHLK